MNLIKNTLIITIILCITHPVIPQMTPPDPGKLQEILEWFQSNHGQFSNYKEKLSSSLVLIEGNKTDSTQECHTTSIVNYGESCLGVLESSNSSFYENTARSLEMLPLKQLENSVNAQYENLLGLMKHLEGLLKEYSRPGVYDNLTITRFAKSIIDLGPSGVDSILDRLFRIVVPQASSRGQHTLLGALSSNLDANDLLSRANNVSSQQTLYNFFNKSLDIEFQGLKLMTHAHHLLAFACNVSSFKGEIKLGIERGNKRIQAYAEAFESTLQLKSRQIRLDEPKKHILGETYLEMTGLYQAMIINKYSLIGTDSCKGTCSAIDVKNFTDCYIRSGTTQNGILANFSSDCPSPRPCYGRLRNCVTLDRPTACILDGKPQRYEKFDDRVSQYHCDDSRKMTFDSWQKNGQTCEYCSCICEDNDDGSESTRFISILPSVTNLTQNKVITGLRFREYQKIIHIQIQQAELGRNGYIVPNTTEWVCLPDMEERRGKNPLRPWTIAGEGKDFVRVTEKTAITYGDALKVKDGQVLTGVGFVLKENGISLELQGTDFCFASGKLLPSSSKTLSTECDEGCSLPTVTFSPSAMASSQFTVPFFDARVFSTPLTPLAGVELSMYRMSSGRLDGENVLTFKLYSLDYNFYLNHTGAWKHRRFTGDFFRRLQLIHNCNTISSKSVLPPEC